MALRILRHSSSANRNTILAIVGIVSLVIFFWAGSRYPELNRKAALGGSLSLQDSLSFDSPLLKVNPQDPFFMRMGFSLVNWVDTNLVGMVFGLLFATFFLTLSKSLKFSKVQRFSGVKGSLLGMFLGAPLGVCANCATPVAQALLQKFKRFDTSSALLISSPTLNVVILGISLTMLPAYLVLLRFALFFLLISIVVPLITRKTTGVVSASRDAMEDFAEQELSWPRTVGNFLGLWSTSLWTVLRAAVPLMLLTGILGVAMTYFVPVDQIVGGEFSLGRILTIAFVATLLPVPIYFDLILCHLLMMQGARLSDVAALYFALGTFSIYPLMIFAKEGYFKPAMFLAVSIVFLSVIAGCLAELYYKFPQTLWQIW